MDLATLNTATSASEGLAERHKPMKRLSRRKFIVSAVVAAPLLILLIGFLIVPLSYIVWGSFEGFNFNFSHYGRVFASASNFNILIHTLRIGLLVTIISVAVAYPVAYLLTRVQARALSVLSVFILIPLFTAFLIRTYAWMIILGREGIVNNTLLWLGVISAPLQLLNSTFAVVVGMTHVFIPMAIFTMYSAMARIDHTFPQAAQVLGAKPIQAFLRVYLPMTLPGVFSACILIFIAAIGFYITPALLGGPSDTMISQLIVDQMTTLLNFELGYASSIVLLLVTIAVLFVASLFIPLEMIWSSNIVSSEEEPRAAARLVKRAKRAFNPIVSVFETSVHVIAGRFLTTSARWLWGYAVVVVMFLTAPLVVVVILSFSSSPFVVFPPPGLSLQWWQKLANASDWHQSFLFSIQLGIAAALVATIIGSMGAFWLVRTRFLFKKMLFLFSLSPLMVPVVIIATSLYIFEARLQILGTFGGLVMGHVLLSVPYVIVVMAAALRNFDDSLEPAAAVHGARPMQTLRLVTLPILKPALFTAGLLAFLTSFDELLVSIFLLGRQTPTLPIKFWGDIKYQIDPLLSAASTLIVLLVTASIITVQLIRDRHNKRTSTSIAE
ncbi:ABC transporter permease [Rhizobium altiplani]|uniref:ABC transporter permease n=1 Tax=Rhizobium altiplani TaxID=1864509 RepID=A0A125Q4P5_9HYPH|nr:MULTISPECIES: ABC transporter permease subunit [Rhizobium]KWV42275.1 ABC transporter permease [Rhizobium altiplani]